MYGKLFTQMYDGTLATEGPWQALVAFQQLIILADKEGVVDMTAEAISRRTTIPLDIISTGLKALEEPDIASRSPSEEGRRIVRLSDSRGWGWRIVNYVHYRNIRSQEERREYMRNYQRKRRAKDKDVNSDVNSDVNNVSNVNQSSKQYADAVTTLSGLQPDVPPLARKNGKDYRTEALEVLEFLNSKTGKKFRGVDGNNKPTASLRLIIDRMQSGVGVQDCKTLIARKHRDWSGDDKMKIYLRPSTLFRASNFEQYLGECVANG